VCEHAAHRWYLLACSGITAGIWHGEQKAFNIALNTYHVLETSLSRQSTTLVLTTKLKIIKIHSKQKQKYAKYLLHFNMLHVYDQPLNVVPPCHEEPSSSDNDFSYLHPDTFLLTNPQCQSTVGNTPTYARQINLIIHISTIEWTRNSTAYPFLKMAVGWVIWPVKTRPRYDL